MFITIDNLKIFYEISGQGNPIIQLHGWGGNHNSFFPITKILQEQFQVITLDLPGFGESEASKTIWGIKEYAKFLSDFMSKIKIENPILIGHSFGGTIAAFLSCNKNINIKKLILVDAKIFKPNNSVKKALLQITAKTGKVMTSFLNKNLQQKIRSQFYNQVGEHDYENLDGVMKQNFIQIIKYDYQKILPKIQVKTLIVWGDKDLDTPLSDANKIKELIPNSQLTILPGTHFAYLEEPEEFCKIVTKFIKEK